MKTTILIGPNASKKSSELSKISQGKDNELHYIPSDRHTNSTTYGYLKQFFNYPNLSSSVSSVLLSPLIMGGYPLSAALDLVKEYLTMFNFQYLFNRKLESLSGGENKIVQIISNILIGRNGIILDNPFDMLDKFRSKEVLELIKKYLNLSEKKVNISNNLIIGITDSDSEAFLSNIEYSYPHNDILKIVIKKSLKRSYILESLLNELANKKSCTKASMNISIQNLSLSIPNEKNRTLFRRYYQKFYGGKVYLILGPNGIGKSLLLSAINGVLPKRIKITDGNICFDDKRLPEPYLKRRIMYRKSNFFNLFASTIYIPQNSIGLLATTNPFEVFNNFSNSYPLLSNYMKGLLEAEIIWNRPTLEASAGQIRFATHLLALIYAYLNPEVKWVFLDEPDSCLDILSQKTISDFVRMISDSGKGVIIVSHKEQNYNFAEIISLKENQND